MPSSGRVPSELRAVQESRRPSPRACILKLDCKCKQKPLRVLSKGMESSEFLKAHSGCLYWEATEVWERKW